MKKWLLIGRGYAGWHASKVGTSSSGGHLEDYQWWADPPGVMTKGYLAEAAEGALIYDASETEDDPPARDLFYSHVIRGPIPNHELMANECQRFAGETETLPPMGERDTAAGCLDYVGLGIYERLLRRIPGVKVGHVRNGAVVWEES